MVNKELFWQFFFFALCLDEFDIIHGHTWFNRTLTVCYGVIWLSDFSLIAVTSSAPLCSVAVRLLTRGRILLRVRTETGHENWYLSQKLMGFFWILKTAFDFPARQISCNPILFTLVQPMTSQVRSRGRIFTFDVPSCKYVYWPLQDKLPKSIDR